MLKNRDVIGMLKNSCSEKFLQILRKTLVTESVPSKVTDFSGCSIITSRIGVGGSQRFS